MWEYISLGRFRNRQQTFQESFTEPNKNAMVTSSCRANATDFRKVKRSVTLVSASWFKVNASLMP